MKTPTLPISSFCKTGSGTTPSREKHDRYFNGSIPWVKSGELREAIITETSESVTEEALAETSLKIAPKGSVLVAMYGANVGRVGILGIAATTNQAVCYLIPEKDKADSRYIFHALQQKLPEFISRSVGGAQPNINQQIIREAKIFFPPIAEQKRIAEILDRTQSLISKRKEAIAKLDTLTQSIFIEMFGDPESILNLWTTQKLGSLLEFLTSGSRGWASYYAESGDLFLRIQNVRWDELLLDDIAFVKAPISAEATRTKVKAGDVLLSITADLGRTAVVPEGISTAYINQHLAILRPKSIQSRFLSAYFASPSGRRQVQGRNQQGVKAGLNFDAIRSFLIPCPPLPLQKEFAQRVEAVEKLKATHRASLSELQVLFASLQHRAFRGEL